MSEKTFSNEPWALSEGITIKFWNLYEVMCMSCVTDVKKVVNRVGDVLKVSIDICVGDDVAHLGDRLVMDETGAWHVVHCSKSKK